MFKGLQGMSLTGNAAAAATASAATAAATATTSAATYAQNTWIFQLT